MIPHKHANLIKAWADGAEIEWKPASHLPWVSIDVTSWVPEYEYRVKPCKKTIGHLFYEIIWPAFDWDTCSTQNLFEGYAEKFLKEYEAMYGKTYHFSNYL